jgi:FAD dependent oxidoreductase TIGR03364
MAPRFDVAVIGGGIVGLAHAWMAARRRLRVVLIERSPAAQGASIQNFGMIWPIGQPAGELHAIAMRSRELWLELNALGAVRVQECGSIHLAHRQDELAVHEEFRVLGHHQVRMLSAAEVARASTIVNAERLLSGMSSASELRVDPRAACAQIASWLADTQGVDCCFGASAVGVQDGTVRTSDGRAWRAGRIIICSGSDLQTLYPQVFDASGLLFCKLQMLRSVAQPLPEHSSPHLASGLTLRHYAAFRDCPSLPRLQTRVQDECPELDRFGIHVMASHSRTGEVILGDSHEYGDQITPFDKTEIDNLILREARKVFRLSDWAISERWNGVYAKHPKSPVYEEMPEEGVHLFVGAGGAGMTMSFGLAERAWKRWLGES